MTSAISSCLQQRSGCSAARVPCLTFRRRIGHSQGCRGVPECIHRRARCLRPIGNFRAQINYIGDFRVLFDYFFPGVIPGKATEVPQEVIDNWDAVYVPKIKAALIANPAAAIELIRVGRVPVWLTPANIEDAVLSVAWYTVFATNDATQQLGGPAIRQYRQVVHGIK